MPPLAAEQQPQAVDLQREANLAAREIQSNRTTLYEHQGTSGGEALVRSWQLVLAEPQPLKELLDLTVAVHADDKQKVHRTLSVESFVRLGGLEPLQQKFQVVLERLFAEPEQFKRAEKPKEKPKPSTSKPKENDRVLIISTSRLTAMLMAKPLSITF